MVEGEVLHYRRSVLWRGLDDFSAEYCTLHQTGTGWRLAGTVLLTIDDAPAQVRYRVECDPAWATRAVMVELQIGEVERALRLAVDDRQRWSGDGADLPALRGCLDVDLSVTPATNTLPIRRLALPVGAGADATAAWVRFPALTVEPLAQRYTHLAERQYRYASATGYSTHLDVDDLGLVMRYPSGWEQVATRGS